jgi:acyl-CoA reductase-like NAD-dependent aldehyde dehydrogenase
MHEHHDLFVAGDWRPAHGRGRQQVLDPATEEVWASVPTADEVDVDRAVAAADDAFAGWAARTPGERAVLVNRLADEVEARATDFTATITHENGTPVAESAGAAPNAGLHLRHVAGLASWLEAEDVRANPWSAGHSVVRRQPLGVAALITPWNYPLSLIIIKLGPALVAGCTVVVKPAPETPMAARMLMDAVVAAGLPPGVVNLVTGGVEAGQALVEHPGVAKVSFTGSTVAGRAIGAACGRLLRPVTLELGGKSPAIVLDDADPAVVAAHIIKVAMRNTGQTCKACTRLLVPTARLDEMVDLVADVVSSAPIGDPTRPDTVFGPLVSARQRDRVVGFLESGAREGAKAVVGGGVPDGFERGFWVEPTVFRDVTPGMRIAREEIFGPVLTVLPYRDVDEAVLLANDSPYGLAATVFGRDEERATAVATRLDTGNIGINHYGSNAAAPFSGHKDSGVGTEFGPEGLAQYLSLTSLHYIA